MLRPQWHFLSEEPPTDIVELLLAQRGLAGAERDAFLHPSLDQLHDPFGLPDMEKAVAKLEWARTWQQPVTVFGDYDCDGVTSTVLLYSLLKQAGMQVDYHVPHRIDDGYGLTEAGVEKVHARGSRLIVTVDNGISANAAVAKANALGMEIVITDHHKQEGELPPAAAVVNPNRKDNEYPFRAIAGVGVAYKLCCALAPRILPAGDADAFLAEALDLVTLGTVADMVPLVDENRVLVAHGLSRVAATKRAGIQALIEQARAKRELDPADIGFKLAPRINAAGRMEGADIALELLLAPDLAAARPLAEKLTGLNAKRQAETLRCEELALDLAEAQAGDDFIVVWHPEMHAGVMGLVAAHIMRRFHRPTLVLRIDGDAAGGSARSIPGYDLSAAFDRHKTLLDGGGGHAMAAGCPLPAANLEALRAALVADASERLTDEMRQPLLEIAAPLEAGQLDLQFMAQLERLAPFGQGNLAPTFALLGQEVQSVRTMGRDSDHLRLSLARCPDAIGWGMGERAETLLPGGRVDIAFRLERNRYKGREQLQLLLQDLKPSE
ncbi:MAG TPA: single-stranded-DNA-specific exonuclease RecJ [Candidatus Poseidoniales archaeon]|nr:single-stranded-DNA-specific exonuclease RecJ [Candidatus Poseidoniales archaeon]